MIESMIVMHLFLLSMTVGSWLILPLTLTISWTDENLELRIACDNHATGLLIGFLDLNDIHKELKRNCVSQIIRANRC